MKKIILTLAIGWFGCTAVNAQKVIEVTNPSNENRQELISIPFDQFAKHFGVDSVFQIVDETSNSTYLYQLEKLGGLTAKNVLIQINIAPKGNLKLTVKGTPAPTVRPKTYARYVPERFDDFAWENDIVAFRMYGKALEGRSDDAQGMDYWAKRTEELIINKWYKENDYHKDHGEGLDYYSVGQTLGAGDIALYLSDNIQYTKHYRDYQILDNGPLRTTFRLIFDTQDFDGQQISLSKTISLDAGQNFNKIKVDLENKTVKNTPIVIGLAKRNESNPEYKFDKKRNTLAYWEPTINDFGQTGTALLIPKGKISFISNDSKQFLLKASIQTGKPFIYHNGASWNKAGKIQSFDAWADLVEKYAESIQKPLKVKLK